METPALNTASDSMAGAWGSPVKFLVCPACDWGYITQAQAAVGPCPHCFTSTLSTVEDPSGLAERARAPELLVPFALGERGLQGSIQNFASRIPYAPEDLNVETLRKRLQQVYVPMYLVDVNLKGTWQAETGYNYQVVSHQDRYDQNSNRWMSHEVQETRVRWEPRAGTIQRNYANVVTPALKEDASLRKSIGDFNYTSSQAFNSLPGGFVRLPNRVPEDAWNETQLILKNIAAEECKKAAGADFQREYQWLPDYQGQNWTLMLLPLYSTFYLDDERKPQAVYIHGQTGKTSGSRRASMKRAQRVALIILAVAAAIFALGLGMAVFGVLFPLLVPIGVVGIVLALLVACGAAVPVLQTWHFNRQSPAPKR